MIALATAPGLDELVRVVDELCDGELRRLGASEPPSAASEPTPTAHRPSAWKVHKPLRDLWTPLTTAIGLDELELGLLSLALAPDIAAKYERLYAYLNDSVVRRWPSVDLAFRLLSPDGCAARRLQLAFAPEGRLFDLGLLEWIGEHSPATARPAMMFRLSTLARQAVLREPIDDPVLTPWLIPVETVQHKLDKANDRPGPPPPMAALLAEGDVPSVLPSIEATVRRHAAIVDMAGLAANGPLDADRRVTLWARLSGACPVLHVQDRLSATQPAILQLGRGIVRRCGQGRWPVAIVLPPGTDADPWTLERPALRLTPQRPSPEQKHALWRRHLERAGFSIADETIDLAVQRYALNGAEIAQAAMTLRAAMADDGSGTVTQQQIFDAARRACRVDLDGLALRSQANEDWSDLVLPPATLAQLQLAVSTVENRDKVMREWGFGRRSRAVNGTAVLFSGLSGTGKTMSAGLVAKALGLDLYCINLAAIVSKYIGETEKNLDRIFTNARRGNAVLLFDEADALFGKRSQVKDARDRYANIEVAYLLQRIESHDGLVILTTNIAKNIDEAFLRRLNIVIEFPLPDMAARERLWRGMLLPPAPIADTVDFMFLARQFELTGGDIRTAAIDAATEAAAADTAIDMPHLLAAVRRLQTKQGRVSRLGDRMADRAGDRLVGGLIGGQALPGRL